MSCNVLLKRALPGLVLLLLGPQFARGGPPSNQQNAQSAQAPRCPDGLYYSEKGDLQGPVEACTVEITVLGQSGETIAKFLHTEKYNFDGSVYQVLVDGGTWRSITYDDHGRELAGWWDGSPDSEETYSYDDQGRLTSIKGPDVTDTFEYDALGRKTRIEKPNVEYSPEEAQSLIYGGALGGLDNPDLLVLPPDRGLVKTLFNEHDQAVESQVYDADGDLMSRLSFQYDAKGRVTEFMCYHRALDFSRSPATGQLIVKPRASGNATGDLVQQISYKYDDQGRVVEVNERSVGEATVTKKAYNEHGNVLEEIKTASGDLARFDPSYVARFSYEYDRFGNWIERTVSSQADANQREHITSITRRLIVYY